MSAVRETEKRQKYAQILASQLGVCAKSVMIIGSVAYGSNYSVTEQSDLEILSVIDPENAEGLLRLNKGLFGEESLQKAVRWLQTKGIDIFKTKVAPNYNYPNYPIKLIFWSGGFFERITKDLKTPCGKRFVQEVPKRRVFLHNFNGRSKEYSYTPIDIAGGKILDYPVHIFENGQYWAGVPVENLLSEPVVVAGDSSYIDERINSLIKALLKEGLSKRQKINLKNLLLRGDKFSPETNRKFERRIQEVKSELL